ncbi:MAG: hypothetical protein HY565_01040 [Candidatus Kerfeldbacteria bacterium]|nr:hypothetical protein [Candidatus Kerfeldbacteria bacterium]
MSIEGKIARRGKKVDAQNEGARKEEFHRFHFGLPESDSKKEKVPTRTRRSIEQSHGEATMERNMERRSSGSVTLGQEPPVTRTAQPDNTDESSSDEERRAQARATIASRQRMALVRQRAEQKGLPQPRPKQTDPASLPPSPAEARPRKLSAEERIAEIRRKAKERL